MKDDKEVLSFDSFEVDDFMLNKVSIKDNDVIDTFEEKDKNDNLETMEEIELPEEKKESKEISEIDSKKKKIKKVKKEKQKKEKKEKQKKEKKKISKRSNIIQISFCLISLVFMLGCVFFYGTRLLKYYKIYNPKNENGQSVTLIASSLTDNVAYQTEGEGLYRINGSSVFKGENINNYFKFSNLIWRIISINSDGTIELVLNDSINSLMFNNKITDFTKSDINNYLNEKFINVLDTEYLTKTSYCLDEVEALDKVSCTNTNTDNYVRLLGITEFINANADNKNYLINEKNYWLYNTSKEKVWSTNIDNVSLSDSNEIYAVKPVIRLKNSNILLGGEGTIESPYYIEKEQNELKIGNYVMLNNDKWFIYDMDDKTISLASLANLSSVYKFSSVKNVYDIEDTTSIAYYLNNSYLENLTYKDIINTRKINIGEYESSYKDVEKQTIDAKVGMYSIEDLKLNDGSMYYLLTPASEGYVYYYSDSVIPSKISLSRNIKPTININKLKINSGNGTIDDPYVLDLEAK